MLQKGPAFEKALKGEAATVPAGTKTYINTVNPGVQAHMADTENEWNKLRLTHVRVYLSLL